MNVRASSCADLQVKDGQSHDVGLRERVYKMIAEGSLDYDAWTLLLSEIEKTYPCHTLPNEITPGDIETISSAYDCFLSKFPLCYWKRTKYAYFKAYLGDGKSATELFAQAEEMLACSVGFWLDYFNFSVRCFNDPYDIRCVFNRGISVVGKDPGCCALWKKYIQFEYSQCQFGFYVRACIQVLKFPTRMLHEYYNDFKEFVAKLEVELQCHKSSSQEVEPGAVLIDVCEISKEEISLVIKDLQDPDVCLRTKALDRYKTIGDHFYQKACELDEKIIKFESKIRRRYYLPTPLDDEELNNWHDYLDFIEKQKDLDWAIKLYERCLISCATYPEFWMRYVEFMESKGGRELALSALDRATQIFLKNVPEIHLFNARFREKIGDANGAHTAFLQRETKSDTLFVENVVNLANMERRLGNVKGASEMYEKAFSVAAEEQKHDILSSLHIHYSRLKFMITGSADAARNVIMNGIKYLPYGKLLIEELMKLSMMHEGAQQLEIVDSIVAKAISPSPEIPGSLDTNDREHLSHLFLEFVDLCGDVHDIRKAWKRHIELFPSFGRTSKKHQTHATSLANGITEPRHSSPFILPKHPYDCKNTDRLIEPPVKQQVPTLPAKDGGPSCQTPVTPLTQEDDVDNTPDRMLVSSTDTMVSSREDAIGMKRSTKDSIAKPNKNVLALIDSTSDLGQHPREDLPGTVEYNDGSIDQSVEDTSEPRNLTSDSGHPPKPRPDSEARPELPNSFNGHRMQEPEPGQAINPVPLENLSIESLSKESQEFVPTSSDCNYVTEETLVSDNTQGDGLNISSNPSVENADSISASDSVCHKGSIEHSLNRYPSLDSSQNTQAENHPAQIVSTSATERCHQVDQMALTSGGRPSGSRDHSPNLQHLSQQSSQQNLTDEKGAPELISQCPLENPSVYQQGSWGAVATSHGWPPNSVPQQNANSTSQLQWPSPPVSHPQQNVLPYAMQTGQHMGNSQPSQAVNPMLQYYYYYEQQQYQNQQLQMQQPYLQPHHQHQNQLSYQQPLLETQQQQIQQQFPQQQLQLQSTPHHLQQFQQEMPYLQQMQQHVYQPVQQMLLPQGQLVPEKYRMEYERQVQQYHQSVELSRQMYQQGYQQDGNQLNSQQFPPHPRGYYQMQQQQDENSEVTVGATAADETEDTRRMKQQPYQHEQLQRQDGV